MNLVLDLSVLISGLGAAVGVGMFFGASKGVSTMKGEVSGLKSRIEGIGASVTRAHEVGNRTAEEVQDMHKELHRGFSELTTSLHSDRVKVQARHAHLEVKLESGLQELRHDIREVQLLLKSAQERINVGDFPQGDGDPPRHPSVRAVK